MRDYRKARADEITCAACRHSGIREISNRLECRLNGCGIVVAKGSTCGQSKLWPQPNDNGVYSKNLADELIQFQAEGSPTVFVMVYVLQIGHEKWLTALSYRFTHGGGGGPLSENSTIYPTKQTALDATFSWVSKELQSYMNATISHNAKDDCRSLIEQISQYQNQGRLF